MSQAMNHLRIAINRALNQADPKYFEESIREGRKLIITVTEGTLVEFKWDPPHFSGEADGVMKDFRYPHHGKK